MNDRFARQTAQHAHQQIAEIRSELRQIERTIVRRSGFQFRCSLCGNPCKKQSRYCHAHSWAEGT
jgi:hypothetical protein